MRISVIGGGIVTDEEYDIAYRLGGRIGSRGHTVVCGGKQGVMEAVCKGATEAEGQTIGILPGTDIAEANPYVSVPLTTGLGNARNVLVVLNGDGVIAVDGAYGTLSEIAHALDMGKPVVGIRTYDIDGVYPTESPIEAVDYLECRLK